MCFRSLVAGALAATLLVGCAADIADSPGQDDDVGEIGERSEAVIGRPPPAWLARLRCDEEVVTFEPGTNRYCVTTTCVSEDLSFSIPWTQCGFTVPRTVSAAPQG